VLSSAGRDATVYSLDPARPDRSVIALTAVWGTCGDFASRQRSRMASSLTGLIPQRDFRPLRSFARHHMSGCRNIDVSTDAGAAFRVRKPGGHEITRAGAGPTRRSTPMAIRCAGARVVLTLTLPRTGPARVSRRDQGLRHRPEGHRRAWRGESVVLRDGSGWLYVANQRVRFMPRTVHAATPYHYV
jgi:hypothetical protein